VDLLWDLSKHPHLDETIVEVGNMKISVVDFKTIHYPVSDEEEQILTSYHKMRKFNPWWLNDKVVDNEQRIISYYDSKRESPIPSFFAIIR